MSSTQQQQHVIVKAYYNDIYETQPEIRRFALDVSSNNDVYQTLETTISQLKADYTPGEFSLQYIDEENDRITFSSNGELQSALKNISHGGIIKIFVKPKSKTNPSSNPNTTIHSGVICDGCQGPVIGNRYKCMECPDYDLCQTCSDHNLHPNHNMLKLTRLSQRRHWGNRPHFWHHHGFQRQHCRPFGFRIPFDVNNLLGQMKGKELADIMEAFIPESVRTETLKEIFNQCKTSEQADKPVDGAVLLENVGKILREVLGSFGVNCNYSVDPQNQTTEPPKETKPEAAAAEPKPNVIPPLNDLFEQFQTIFAPMFQPPTTTTTPAQDQKKIDECIQRLLAMGFVDSNGVLTELVKGKNGDLDQVLDALNPRNHKN